MATTPAPTPAAPAAGASPPVGAAPSEAHGRLTPWLLLVGAVVVVAGLLFGYDQGVISGALAGIQKSFDLSTTAIEIITSWVTLGALFGALVAGMIADRFGRKPTIIGAGTLFTLGALIEATAPGTSVLVVGRLVVGLGVGVASVAAPLYAAEMAPSWLRGTYVSVYQLGITVGIFVAYLIDELLNSSQWRLELGLSAVVGILLLLAISPLPDSPRWYAKVGKTDKAAKALRRIEERDDVSAEMDEIRASLDEDARKATWGEVFSRRWRRPLVLGLGLSLFQQITGINAIIYYSDKIFAAAGFATPAEQTAATTWAIGAVNVVFTLVAVAFVDRLGRRPLLLAGLVGMAGSLAVVGLAFRNLDDIRIDSTSATNAPSDSGIYMLVALVIFIASFAFSMGPVVWAVINEIFPSRVRGRAVSLATAVNWLSAWVVSQFFLTLVNAIGEPATFGLFSALCVVAFVFVLRLLPETKGKSLEQIEQMWTAKAAAER